MQDYWIFTAAIVVAAIAFTALNLIWLKKSFMARVGVYVIILVTLLCDITFLISKLGIAHLFWALPLGTVIVVIALFQIIKEVKTPFREIKFHLRKVVAGELDLNITEEQLGRRDEVGKVFRLYEAYIRQSKRANRFAEAIGKGDLNHEFEPSSDNDRLGLSLQQMRDQLQLAMTDVQHLLDVALKEGKINSKIGLDGKSGIWLELADDLNKLMDSIAGPMMSFTAIIQASAQGDLTKRFEGHAAGDIKNTADNLNQAMESIGAIIHKVNVKTSLLTETIREMESSGAEMTSSTTEIASATAQMSDGSRRQLQQVEEISGLLEEIKSASGSIAKQTEEIHSAAGIVANHSAKGNELVNSLVNNMNLIAEESQQTEQNMAQLSGNTGEIVQIISVVNDIAKQTNMLALNAGIEASQAGEYGKGFAVIAEEIRVLAQKSRQSTDEITQIVEQVTSDTASAIASVHSLNSSLKESQQITKSTQMAFENITKSSTANHGRSNEILKEVNGQYGRIDHVARLSESVVVIAEQTSAGTEEIASSAAELSSGMQSFNKQTSVIGKVAERLNELTGRFITQKKEL